MPEAGALSLIARFEAPAGRDALERVRAAVEADGGLLAGALAPAPRMDEGPCFGALVAAGPRAAGDPAGYELTVELIREAYLLHFGDGRVLRPLDDDLALLAGDRLYALGLAELARLGDIEAIVELADVIALSALANATGKRALAEAVWAAGAVAVGWGAAPGHDRAKRLVRAGDPAAEREMRAVADSGQTSPA